MFTVVEMISIIRSFINEQINKVEREMGDLNQEIAQLDRMDRNGGWEFEEQKKTRFLLLDELQGQWWDWDSRLRDLAGFEIDNRDLWSLHGALNFYAPEFPQHQGCWDLYTRLSAEIDEAQREVEELINLTWRVDPAIMAADGWL